MATLRTLLAFRWPILLWVSVASALPARAGAQGVFDAVGSRGLGLGGAFVGVADDATAVHWNPAGLVGGGPAGVTIGWHHFQLGKFDGPAAAGGARGRSSLTSLGTWPFGFSYGTMERRLARTDAQGVTRVTRLGVRHAGVTVLQSILDGLVVGATVRVLRAETSENEALLETLSEALARDPSADGERRTSIDADLGLMASSPRMRVGLTVRNLRSMAVRAMPGSDVRLPRQARVGLSLLPADGVTLAMDVDLNTVDLMGDLRRMSALGAEFPLGTRLLVRSGVRWNLALSSKPAGAIGASVLVRRGLWIDAHYAHGSADEARQMSVAFRGGL